MASRLQIAGDLEALLSQSGQVIDERGMNLSTRIGKRASLPRNTAMMSPPPAAANTNPQPVPPQPAAPANHLSRIFGLQSPSSSAGPPQMPAAVASNPTTVRSKRGSQESIESGAMQSNRSSMMSGRGSLPPEGLAGFALGSGGAAGFSALPAALPSGRGSLGATQLAAGARATAANPTARSSATFNPLTGGVALPSAPTPTLAALGLNPTSPPARSPREIKLPRGFSSAARRAAATQNDGSLDAVASPSIESSGPLSAELSPISPNRSIPLASFPSPPPDARHLVSSAPRSARGAAPSGHASQAPPHSAGPFGTGNPFYPSSHPSLGRAPSLLATSDMDFAPTVVRTLNLNASSPAPALQIAPTPPTKFMSPILTPLVGAPAAGLTSPPLQPVAPVTSELVQALLEKANSNVAAAAAIGSKGSIGSPLQQSQLSNPYTQPASAPVLSPRSTRLKAGTGSAVWNGKRASTAAGGDGSINPRASARMSGLALSPAGLHDPSALADETFTVPHVASNVPGLASNIAAASSNDPTGDGSDTISALPSTSSLRTAQAISRPERPSPTMLSRPSVAFVATHEGMSLLEAIEHAKAVERAKQAERDRLKTEGGTIDTSTFPPLTPSPGPSGTATTATPAVGSPNGAGRALVRPRFGEPPSLVLARERSASGASSGPSSALPSASSPLSPRTVSFGVPALGMIPVGGGAVIGSGSGLTSPKGVPPPLLLAPSQPMDLHRVVGDPTAASPQSASGAQSARTPSVVRRASSTRRAGSIQLRRGTLSDGLTNGNGSQTARSATSGGDETGEYIPSDDEEGENELAWGGGEAKGEDSPTSPPGRGKDNTSPSVPDFPRRASTGRGSLPPDLVKRLSGQHMLIDPLTGLPIDRSKKRASAVWMGVIEDTSQPLSPTSQGDLAQAQALLNSLSPLHSAAMSSSGGILSPNSSIGGDGLGAQAMEQMMSSVKVERVELKTLFKAPTLMQQAKVITAAIILQKQARIAERRAIIQKRQQEADALEQELEEQAALAAAQAREQRIREQRLRLERHASKEFGFQMTQADAEAFARLNDNPAEAESKTETSAPLSPRFRGSGGGGFLSRLPSTKRRSLDFAEFDFTGKGMAWGKDQAGSHLIRQTRKDADDAAEVSQEAPPEDLTPKIHSSGFGTGETKDNNGAHHPLMNPTHPNFFSHLNPNSTNYNSHINPKHENYNPLNNPQHPDHDEKYNNPRHPLFNPFYKHPRLMADQQYLKDTWHLHGGSALHPAHPAHPLFTPHAPAHLTGSTTEVNASGGSGTVRPGSSGNTNVIQTPSGGLHKWAPNSGRRGASGVFSADGSPLNSPAFTRQGSIQQQPSGPSSPRSGGGSGFGSGFGGRSPTTPRRSFQPGNFAREKQMAEELAKALTERSVTAAAGAGKEIQPAASNEPPMPPFNPADPLASLDLSGKTGVPLHKQFSRLTHQQLELIRREAINGSLGMPTGNAGGKGGSSTSGMSKFFRETLQRALGGDEVWKIAQEMHANGSQRGGPNDPLKGISLSSLSLKAHMALFGAGALTDSDGRPIDENGCYLDVADERGERATAIAPFPPKKFFLSGEVELYESELREQLKKDHEVRVREYEDVVNVAKRRWANDPNAIHEFHTRQDHLIERTKQANDGAAFLGRVVANQWNVY